MGSSFWICCHLGPDAFDHIDRVGVRQNEDAHEDGALPGEADLGVVIFRAEHDVGDVAQPNEYAVFLPHDEILEILHRMQVGVRGQIDLHERALGAAEGGEKIIRGQAPGGPAPG